MQNSRGNNSCTQDCDRNWEFKISFWKNTAAMREDVGDTCVYQQKYIVDTYVGLSAYRWYWWWLYVSAHRWYWWCFCMSVSMQVISVMTMSAHRGYWWGFCRSVSMQMILVMPECLSAHRGYWWCFCRSVGIQMILVMTVCLSTQMVLVMLL